ncbi:MAG TPA: hypothetical protein VHO47_00340 [Candidatus Babeliales bacterium]|nr:hypothetical protein [Candidatus Babeliales bacterium]
MKHLKKPSFIALALLISVNVNAMVQTSLASLDASKYPILTAAPLTIRNISSFIGYLKGQISILKLAETAEQKQNAIAKFRAVIDELSLLEDDVMVGLTAAEKEYLNDAIKQAWIDAKK